MHNLEEYPYEIRPLSLAEGGGFLIRFTDFSGCISDGDTEAQAIENGRDALIATLNALRLENLPIPAPHSGNRIRVA
jgi:antitoxin HicB